MDPEPEPDPELSEKSEPDPEIIFSAPTNCPSVHEKQDSDPKKLVPGRGPQDLLAVTSV